MNEKLLFAEANELLQQPTEIHAGILISKVFTNRSMQEIAKLSTIITEQQEHAITYFVIENEDKLQCILACGKTVTLEMNALLKEALPTIEGKGGGNKKECARRWESAYDWGRVFKSACFFFTVGSIKHVYEG